MDDGAKQQQGNVSNKFELIYAIHEEGEGLSPTYKTNAGKSFILVYWLPTWSWYFCIFSANRNGRVSANRSSGYYLTLPLRRAHEYI